MKKMTLVHACLYSTFAIALAVGTAYAAIGSYDSIKIGGGTDPAVDKIQFNNADSGVRDQVIFTAGGDIVSDSGTLRLLGYEELRMKILGVSSGGLVEVAEDTNGFYARLVGEGTISGHAEITASGSGGARMQADTGAFFWANTNGTAEMEADSGAYVRCLSSGDVVIRLGS